MDDALLAGFAQACEHTTAIIGRPEVAGHWADASCLTGLSVGGIAAHTYAAIRRFEVALDEEPVAAPRTITLPEFYGLNRVDDPHDLEAGWHPLLRDDAEQRAGGGADAVLGRFRDVTSRLLRRLPAEPAGRPVPVWTVPDAVTLLETYVTTRVVELLVHADDLATSVGVDVQLPDAAASIAIGAFVEMARYRVGSVAVVRAFARSERAAPDTLRVL